MNRPTIIDRFELHKTVIEMGKANQRTKDEIERTEGKIEKLKKRLQESQ